MAEWWMTAEGARTINMVGDFAKKGIAFMLGVEDLFERIAASLESLAEQKEKDRLVDAAAANPTHFVNFSTAIGLLLVEGIWNETVPGYFHFVPKHGLYLNGALIHLEAIEVDEGAMGIQKSKHRDNEKEYDTLTRLCDKVPITMQIVANAGGGLRKVVPFVVPGER